MAKWKNLVNLQKAFLSLVNLIQPSNYVQREFLFFKELCLASKITGQSHKHFVRSLFICWPNPYKGFFFYSRILLFCFCKVLDIKPTVFSSSSLQCRVLNHTWSSTCMCRIAIEMNALLYLLIGPKYCMCFMRGRFWNQCMYGVSSALIDNFCLSQ